MSPDDPLKTSLTLLGRLRRDPKDQAAWSEFVARYGPRILQWCRGWGLQESDAQGVTQDVLLKLNRLMAAFVYDSSGSFRGWLKTLTHHAWRDLAAEHRRSRLGVGDRSVSVLLESLQAGDDLVEQLDAEFQQEAMERMRRRVLAWTWDAFRLTTLEGWCGATVAVRLEMPIQVVIYVKHFAERSPPVQFPQLAPSRFRRSLAGRYVAPLDRRAGERGRLPSIWRSALRSDRPKRRTVALRASVGSTDAPSERARGSTQFCTPVTLDS
jgi:RNA polymerase sigma-70 factor (ECF subfamily)